MNFEFDKIIAELKKSTPIALVTLVTVVVSMIAVAEANSIHKLRSQNGDLLAKLNDKTKMENATLSRECSDKADKVFKNLGYSISSGLDSYFNHYSPKLSKCFMEISSTSFSKDRVMNALSLFDAYDGRPYANYMDNTSLSGDDNKLHLNQCELNPLGKSTSYCKSENEYKAFVRNYLE